MKPMLTMKQYYVKPVARILFVIMWLELLAPMQQAMALTSGPTTPEMGGFEPVGTTDMVNTFSGDFVYNLPLFDLEGYPVNLAYHSGSGMEDEASWVGLGWSLNPGQINRAVRGIPDDYNGEEVFKRLHINTERNFVFNTGANIGFELFGAVNLGLGSNVDIIYNNYKGFSAGINGGINLSIPKDHGPYSHSGVGINGGINSQSGADINTTMRLAVNEKVRTNEGGSLSIGTGFNSRYGMKSVDLHIKVQNPASKNMPLEHSKQIPIGQQNYTPAHTHIYHQTGLAFRTQLGLEAAYAFPHFHVGMTYSQTDYESDGTRRAFGYLNLQHADRESILDFSRDKDGTYNESHASLPTSALAYDIFNVNGQGTGGMFRPFRNDIGAIYDPALVSSQPQVSTSFELGGPIGPVGGLFEAGFNLSFVNIANKSGAAHNESVYQDLFKFRKGAIDHNYENVYFKNGGELTYNKIWDEALFYGKEPVIIENRKISNTEGRSFQPANGMLSRKDERTFRAVSYNYLSNEEAIAAGMMPGLLNYPLNTVANHDSREPEIIPRDQGREFDRVKPGHIGEFYQTLPDGRRYIYALPAVNSVQREATFSVTDASADKARGTVPFSTEDKMNNGVGKEEFFQATINPAHAYAYLLTSVLSPDYVDLLGDGPTEDDIGSYTRFNYHRAAHNYRWISPYSRTGNLANYHPGNRSDPNDDKASYIVGAKDMWYVSTMESKNQVAEFYISQRADARGTKAPVIKNTDDFSAALGDPALKQAAAEEGYSYKLDSIVIYTKQERYMNGTGAVPLKTIIFNYDYSLCPGVPNNFSNQGKLTLKKVYTRNGTSNISLLNPYEFEYDLQNGNAGYDLAGKDRWGNYKPNNANPAGVYNSDFPYTLQDKAASDAYAAHWQLKKITLPSGAKLEITYESDDYSYVQDKRAMEMRFIAGVGNTPDFLPTDELYQEPTSLNDYVYLKRDKHRESTGLSLADNYLDGDDMLYFSFSVDIGNKSKYEQVTGYALVDGIGVCPDNSDYLYIKLKGEKAGEKTDARIHPVSLAALNYGKLYVPQLIYPGYRDENTSNLEAILNGLGDAAREMGNIFGNMNLLLLEKRNLAQDIKIHNCWVRTYSPGFTKLGGGQRVKNLVLSDGWNAMTQSYNSTYGKQYDYTMISERTGEVISSGVAVNEPVIGGDENAMRRPEPYMASSGRLVPPVQMFKETPHAESYLPGASVGYSRVLVKSIHASDAKSSKYETVQEFYTARDFPVRVEQTPIREISSKKVLKFLLNETEKSVSQGYAVILNDMHGKLKATADYVIRTTGSLVNAKREEISSQEFVYQTDSKGQLYNQVKALMPPSGSQTGYTIRDIILGEDADLNHDVRHTSSRMTSYTTNANTNAVNFLMITIPIPSFFSLNKVREESFTSQVTTKFVQQYGILKKVISYSHGAKTEQENLLYDAQSGQVLHATTTNEYNDKLNVLRLPAYLGHHYMAAAAVNEGMVFSSDSIYVHYGTAYMKPKCNYDYVKEGDEILVTWQDPDDLSQRYAMKMWVVGVGDLLTPPPHLANGTLTSEQLFRGFDYEQASPPPGIIQPSPECRYLKLQPGLLIYSVRDLPQQWGADKNYSGVNVVAKIIRSGNRNHLDATMQEISFLGNKTFTSFASLFEMSYFDKIIGTSVTTYNNLTEQNLWGFTGNYPNTYNPYVSGARGNVKARAGYVYHTQRSYSDNARYDGAFTDYFSFWQPVPGNSGTCNMYRVPARINPGLSNRWMAGDNVITYNNYNQPVETQTNTGVISSGLYGYNHTMPLMLGQNARSKELVYYGFEEDTYFRPKNMYDNGHKTTYPLLDYRERETMDPFGSYTTFRRYGRDYYNHISDHFYNGFSYNLNPHTGTYSLRVDNTAQRFYIMDVSRLVNGRNYTLSFWLRNNDGSRPALGQVIIRCYNPVTQQMVNSPHSVLSIVAGPIDGWYKVEARLSSPLPNIPAGLEQRSIELSFANANQLVDDIRLVPADAACVAYVYHPKTLRLMAQLDNNNYATFYEYDAEGNMVRTKKETDRGILTINENRKSFTK